VDLLTILLSRIQFGFTIGFHIIFPTLNIGLAIFITVMEALWLKNRNPDYLKICKFWTKIFALTFGMGVVSGVVLSYELGTNFGRFTAAVGSVLGPLFGYEVLSAFFLEAGFLGIMLFGWNRVGPKLHFCATLLVAIGTIISAFWILSANSWMQTPAGYEIVNNKFIVLSWWQAIFNPSFLPRFLHMLMASLVTSIFFIAAVSGWYLLRNRHPEVAKPCYSLVLASAIVLVPLQILLGDTVGLVVHDYQPLKTAAMEANWQTMQGAPLVLFAIPDAKQEKNLYEISVPYGASLFNTHTLNGTLQGITAFPRNNWPLISTIFFSFRIMVGIGMLFLALAFYAMWLRWRKKLFDNHLLMRACILASPLGFVATLAGWITAESGRQPWIVYNLIRTQDGASIVPFQHVALSLLIFIVVYSIVFSFYLYYLFKFIKKGPVELDVQPTTFNYLSSPKELEP
jgi:cytochrome d ubiquinol oxidase subunit I